MRYILIPVKDLTQAKQRLAEVMTQEERTLMAWTMLESTFAAARASKRADRIAIVTLYQPAAELARSYGMEVIVETEQISESVSVDFGSREVERRGATAVLRLPIDLPLITTGEIDEIFAHDGPEPSTVIVPSRDGTGTNAILRRPGTLFASQFGPHSLPKHLAAAARKRANYEVIHLSGIELDIDDRDDLREFLARGQGTKLYELLVGIGVPERLGK